jgi:hypothetical protein
MMCGETTLNALSWSNTSFAWGSERTHEGIGFSTRKLVGLVVSGAVRGEGES